MTCTVLFGININFKKKPFLNNGRQSKAAVLHFREVGLLKFQKNCLFKRKKHFTSTNVVILRLLA